MNPALFKKSDFDDLVNSSEEFSCSKKDGFTVYSYHMAFADTFESDNQYNKSVRLNARGIVFSDSGELLRLPFDKFFNLNEKACTQYNLLKNKEILWVHNKLDGTMIAPFILNSEVIWGTKRVADGFSADVDACLKSKGLYEEYVNFVRYCISCNYTPMFEYHNPDNPNTVIVLRYNESFLRLTAVRSMQTGDYVNIQFADSNDETLNKMINDFDNKVEEIKITSIQDIVDEMSDTEDLEGRVLMIKDMGLIKIKTPWYVVRHKIVELFENKHILAQIVLDTSDVKYDDLLSILSDEDANKLNEFSIYIKEMINNFTSYIREKANKYNSASDYASSDDSKEYNEFNRCVFALINNKHAYERLYNDVIAVISKKAYKQLRFQNFIEQYNKKFCIIRNANDANNEKNTA